VSTELAGAPAAGRESSASLVRYYELAKHQEWHAEHLPWNELPPIPETKGSAQRRQRRRDLWRSVITQQLQADLLAVAMTVQLLELAQHPEAGLYYSTMVQDEARHVESWLRLAGAVGGTGMRDPYLDKLAHFQLNLETLEEKVFGMQVWFERIIIPRFRVIARAARGTVLEDLCNRLTVDDGIHHSAGVAYERVLLAMAPRKTKQKLARGLDFILPVFIEHLLWRPPERAWLGTAMESRDRVRARAEIEQGLRIAASLGVDVTEVRVPA
jgi:hypothetical protein